MKNKSEGFTTGRILALLLATAMILTLGLTAAVSADDGETEEIAVIEINEPAEEAADDFEEIAVLDEEDLIRAAEKVKKEARVRIIILPSPESVIISFDCEPDKLAETTEVL